MSLNGSSALFVRFHAEAGRATHRRETPAMENLAALQSREVWDLEGDSVKSNASNVA